MPDGAISTIFLSDIWGSTECNAKSAILTFPFIPPIVIQKGKIKDWERTKMTREVSAQPLLALAFSEQYPNLRRAVVQRPPRARLPPPKPEPHYAQSQGVEPTSVVR